MKLRCGLQIMHNGTPIELLHIIGRNGLNETWMVRTLFVEPQEFPRLIKPEDSVSRLHAKTMGASYGRV